MDQVNIEEVHRNSTTGERNVEKIEASPPIRPICFGSQEKWELWLKVATIEKPQKENSYCEDCTPEYQSQMIRENRCGHPETTFVSGFGERTTVKIRKSLGVTWGHD